MSSKRAYYYHKKFNWKELTNLFCYDVKMPERLSKRQQILRLYKNCSRRLFEIEILGFQSTDLNSFAKRMQDMKNEFAALKNTNSEKDIDEVLEKYEQFMEITYTETPWTHDNVAYEWRHGKGLPSFDKEEIETDLWGYYDKKLLNYYPDPLEWQFRDEYPFEDNMTYNDPYSPNEWDRVNVNDTSISQSAQTPQEFQKEVEALKSKYQLNKPNMWEKH